MAADDFRETVRAQCPAEVLNLWDEIERFASTDLIVSERTDPREENDPNPDAPACRVSHTEAQLQFRSFSCVQVGGVLHELLHIRRYWIEQIPQIVPKSDLDAHWAVTSSIENNIEHLFIVPQERTFGIDKQDYWNETSRWTWMQYPWPWIPDSFARRNAAFFSWVAANELCNDPSIIDAARIALIAERLLDEAERFRQKLLKVHPSKTRMAATAVRFLKIPFQEVDLVYLDIRNRSRRFEELPRN